MMEARYSKEGILEELQSYQKRLDDFEGDFINDLGYTDDDIIQLIKDFHKTLSISKVFVGIAKEPEN